MKGLALSPAADLLFSASSDGTIKAWKLQEPLVSVHNSLIHHLAVWAFPRLLLLLLLQSESKCLSSMDTGSRLTCLAIVSPISLLKELKDPFLQDPAGEEPEEMLNQAQTYERDKIAPSTSGKEMKGERHKEVVLSEKRSCSQEEADPRASTKKRVKKGLASKSGTSQVVVSRVKVKQGKMSRRRLLLRKKYYSLKQLGHKK